MRLFELFAQPYQFKRKSDSYYEFKSKDSLYSVVFQWSPLELEDDVEVESVNVQFSLNLDNRSTQGITDSGDAFNVFATVWAIIRDFVKANPEVEFIWFTASGSEPSRIRLYTTFMKQIPRILPGWEVYDDQRKDGRDQIYILNKMGAI